MLTNVVQMQGSPGLFEIINITGVSKTLEELIPGILGSGDRPASQCTIQVDPQDLLGVARAAGLGAVRFTADWDEDTGEISTDVPIQDGATARGLRLDAGGKIVLQNLDEMKAFKIIAAVAGETVKLQIQQYFATFDA